MTSQGKLGSRTRFFIHKRWFLIQDPFLTSEQRCFRPHFTLQSRVTGPTSILYLPLVQILLRAYRRAGMSCTQLCSCVVCISLQASVFAILSGFWSRPFLCYLARTARHWGTHVTRPSLSCAATLSSQCFSGFCFRVASDFTVTFRDEVIPSS